MPFRVSRSLSRFIIYFSCTEKLLGVWSLVENNTKACSHVDNLSRSIVKYVLTRILTAIAIDIFKLISYIRLFFVYWRMICGLNNSTNPRFNCHKFLLFNFTFNNFKAIRLRILYKFTSLTCFFVNSNTNRDVVLNELWWLSPTSSTLSFFRLTSTHKIVTFNIIKK